VYEDRVDTEIGSDGTSMLPASTAEAWGQLRVSLQTHKTDYGQRSDNPYFQ
jgi:hypothetical protein